MGNTESSQADHEYMVKFRKEIANGGIRMVYNHLTHSVAFFNQSSIPVYFKCTIGTSFIPSFTGEMTLLPPSSYITAPLDMINGYIIAPVVTYPYKGKSLRRSMHFGTIRVPPGEGLYIREIVLRSVGCNSILTCCQ